MHLLVLVRSYLVAAGTFAACRYLPMTASDKGPSSALALADLGNNVAAGVRVSGDIVVGVELEDRYVVVERKVCGLVVLAEGVGIEVAVEMGLDLASVVLGLDDIHSAPHSACSHSVADSHLVEVAFVEEPFAHLLAFPKPASPSSVFVDSYRS